MSDSTPSRRDFLVSSAWLALNLPAIRAAAEYALRAAQSGQVFQVLTAQEAAELEAVAIQIFPTDDTPGAREAGVIHFIDRALGTFASDLADPIRNGLGELRAAVRAKHPTHDAFSGLGFDQQTEMLKGIEDSDFFSTVRYLTVAGMFASPSYGGNREDVGWKILGFEDRPVWQPPFGYYDRVDRDGSG